MARVVVITADAVYQGDVELSAPGGQPVRFLDALRTPQRIGQGAIGASPGLVLERWSGRRAAAAKRSRSHRR